MKYIKHIVLMAFVMVMTGNAWAQIEHCTTDTYSWCFQMPAGNHVLRTTWIQDAGLAYAKSDTTVYLGDPFSGQELTNPHHIPVTYSITPKTGTNSGNTINDAGVVTINGIGIDTVKAIFAGNDTLLPDTAMYIINSRTLYTLTVASNGIGSIEVERVLSTTILNDSIATNYSGVKKYTGNTFTVTAEYAPSNITGIIIRKIGNQNYYVYVTANDGQTLIDSIIITSNDDVSHINTDHGIVGNITALGNAQNSVTIKDINATSVQIGCESNYIIRVRGVNVFYHNNVTEVLNATITSNTTASYTLENNTTVKLNANANTDNYFAGWNDQNTDNPRYITVTRDTTIQGNFEKDFEGSGTEDDPYLIPSIEKWNILADRVEAGKTYEGKFFKQTADVGPVTKSVGIYDADSIVNKPFNGSYDGQEHYLEVNYTPNNYYKLCAPFMSVDGATIKNLHTTGLISTAGKFAAGLIGRPKTTKKTTNVINCRSSVEIRALNYSDHDGTHGGFVGVTDAAMNFVGCVFDGKLVGQHGTYTRSSGGFIGWTESDASVHFKDCIFAPELVSMGDSLSCTFSRARKDTSLHFTNCYYTQAFGKEQGKQMDSITAGEYVTSLTFAGNDTVYTVSGITAYANNMGLKYGDKFYAGNEDVVELSLSHADRTADGFSFNIYSASNGGIINGTTLTMPDTSTVINANYNLIYTLTLASNDPTMGTVTLNSIPAGVTVKDADAKEYYVVPGTTVTVSATVTATPAENFHLVNWTDENSNVMGTDAQITLTINGDTTVQGNFERDFEGSGTEDDPYLIPSRIKWNLLATRVGVGNSYEGKYFRQTADINQTNLHRVGNGYPFSGIYDGQGHSIPLAMPFFIVDGATIKNLHIKGTVGSQFDAGLIYRINQSDKTTNIINCRSSIEIRSTASHDYDGTNGGFVGVTKASINFIGCVFDGKFVGVYGPYCRSNGGFIGWTEKEASVHFKDCIFAPEIVSMGDSLSCTFSRARKDTSLHFTNCYYTQAYGTEQGKQMDSITAGEYITSLAFAGIDTVYTVSGITAYANNMGLKYGDKFYAGNGDVVELSLSHADRTADGFSFNSYSASNGGIINGTTLTMPDTSTVISANYDMPHYTLTLASNDAQMGTVAIAMPLPAGVTDNHNGTYTVVFGTEVTVTATPNENYYFKNWNTEDAINSNVAVTNTFTVTKDSTLIAHFVAKPVLTLTAIGNGTVEIQTTSGNKTIIPGSYFINNTKNCTWCSDNEKCDKLFDGIITGSNKWCTDVDDKQVIFWSSNAVQVSGYTLYTANDNLSNPGRNPKSWVLKANLDGGDNWTTIDAVSNDNTMQNVNYTPFDFEMDVPGTYRYFRFEVSEVHGSNNILQLGEMQLFSLGNTLPDGVIQGPNPDTYIVDYGTVVTVKAIPEAGYALLDWSDDHSTADTRTITVTSDTNLVATFGFLTPGLTPLGELTISGHSFVSETGEIKGVPRITETGEFNKVSGREPTTIDLSTITEAFTAQNGDTLTGMLGAKVKISIAKGATVTLDGATINGTHSMSYLWAGITCKGDATIILKDGTTNNVTGFNNEYPGVYVPVGSTLTIEGTGKLIAGSNGFAAGIGAGLNHKSCGNIIIQGGTIEATGDLYAAGIGGAYVSTCGDIEITGGNITAKGGVGAAGIGGGRGANCGAIHISGGTIVATGGDDAAGIGGGGPIDNYTHCGSITISSTVTSVTAKKGNGALYSIGAGKNGTCGTVTIGDSTGAISTSPYTYQPTQP